jgi:hypothetical protein
MLNRPARRAIFVNASCVICVTTGPLNPIEIWVVLRKAADGAESKMLAKSSFSARICQIIV